MSEPFEQPHAFFATPTKGTGVRQEGWTNRCDICGGGLNTLAHRAATASDHREALLAAIEGRE
jgi:hypothetical protein